MCPNLDSEVRVLGGQAMIQEIVHRASKLSSTSSWETLGDEELEMLIRVPCVCPQAVLIVCRRPRTRERESVSPMSSAVASV
eukprot:3936872-Rhodomonas_salina.5